MQNDHKDRHNEQNGKQNAAKLPRINTKGWKMTTKRHRIDKKRSKMNRYGCKMTTGMEDEYKVKWGHAQRPRRILNDHKVKLNEPKEVQNDQKNMQIIHKKCKMTTKRNNKNKYGHEMTTMTWIGMQNEHKGCQKCYQKCKKSTKRLQKDSTKTLLLRWWWF